MERHTTDLIKKSLHNVTSAEFGMFINFLKGLSIFGGKAPLEHVQELLEIIEAQADLVAQFNRGILNTDVCIVAKVSDGDHINRIKSCLYLAVPFFKRGASNSKFLN